MVNEINGQPQGEMKFSRFADHQIQPPLVSSKVGKQNRNSWTRRENEGVRGQWMFFQCVQLEMEKVEQAKARQASRGGRPKGGFGPSFPTGQLR